MLFCHLLIFFQNKLFKKKKKKKKRNTITVKQFGSRSGPTKVAENTCRQIVKINNNFFYQDIIAFFTTFIVILLIHVESQGHHKNPLLITTLYSLETDQDRQNAGPDLDPTV